VLQIFGVKKKGVAEKTAIAGCKVLEGCLRRGNPVRVLRSGQVVFEGKLDTLKREKNDVDRVDKGKECGLTLAYQDWQVGDVVECMEEVMRRPKLISDKSGKLTLQA
jgi:translation initiation factor IF-2